MNPRGEAEWRRFHAYDNDFDGEADAIGDTRNGSIRVRYAGDWHEVVYSEGRVFLDVDGEQVPVSIMGGFAVIPDDEE